MIRFALVLVLVCGACLAATQSSAQWPAPKAPVIPQADGYVAIPDAAVAPRKDLVFRAVFDATRAPEKPTEILPALNMAGSELNAVGASDVSLQNAKFVVVFHGSAMDAISSDEHYKAKFGVSNPNLPVLAAFKKVGVELYVCGQQLAADNVDPKSITPDVTIASDALLVLIAYQNEGYALLSF
jgi:intracellular sulfur oxidation DsrE/DsrF family protein